MNTKLKTGIILGAGSQLANLVSGSDIGTAAYDKMNASYGLEHFINGATQAGAFAGATLASYGLTKTLVKKCIPFASETTSKAGALTTAVSVAYALAKTDVFRDAMYNMTAYDHQLARGLEAIATVGIAAGTVVTGTLFAKDLYDLASVKVKKMLNKE